MKEYIRERLDAALASMDGVPKEFEPELATPANADHGDLTTNSALQLARHLRCAPRQIAEDLVSRLTLDKERVAACEIAGAGFINFRFAEHYVSHALSALLKAGAMYGRTRDGEGRCALVEFVSANPTGPLTVGHGRNAVLGDTIANLLEWTGYSVTREYYFNDGGRQMRVLGLSVRARYEEVLAGRGHPVENYATKLLDTVEVPVSFPDDGYQGEYIRDTARSLADSQGATLLGSASADVFKEAAKKAIFADIERTLGRLHIHMDTFFNEHSLYENGEVRRALDDLRKCKDEYGRPYIYDKDGAVWFRTSLLGKETDTVLEKSSGEPTYRLPDIAYHRDKYCRKFDVMVNVFGADHIATYPDVLHALEILKYDTEKIDVVIYQFVTLVRRGEEGKMSTRKARYVTLDELMDEVGVDVTRFFFLMRSSNTHLEFDLDLAREASDKNPVFYLQYAHARICSILEKAEETGFVFDEGADLTLLRHEAEIALAKELLRFPEALSRIAAAREPHRLVFYLRIVAGAFTRFYHHCRIIGEDRELATARMHLACATRIVLHNGLAILGISAPERM